MRRSFLVTLLAATAMLPAAAMAQDEDQRSRFTAEPDLRVQENRASETFGGGNFRQRRGDDGNDQPRQRMERAAQPAFQPAPPPLQPPLQGAALAAVVQERQQEAGALDRAGRLDSGIAPRDRMQGREEFRQDRRDDRGAFRTSPAISPVITPVVPPAGVSVAQIDRRDDRRDFRNERRDDRQDFRRERFDDRQGFRQDFRQDLGRDQGGVRNGGVPAPVVQGDRRDFRNDRRDDRQDFRADRRDDRQDFRQDRRFDNNDIRNRPFNGQEFGNGRGFDNGRGFGNPGYTDRFDRDPRQGFRNRDNDWRGREFGNRGNWNRGWRQNRQFNWQGYRGYNRNAFHLPRYYAPYGWNGGYQRFGIGFSLNRVLFGQNYWIGDPAFYRLPPAYGPYEWVRYYNDAVLVDIRTGYVVDVVYDIFW